MGVCVCVSDKSSSNVKYFLYRTTSKKKKVRCAMLIINEENEKAGMYIDNFVSDEDRITYSYRLLYMYESDSNFHYTLPSDEVLIKLYILSLFSQRNFRFSYSRV